MIGVPSRSGQDVSPTTSIFVQLLDEIGQIVDQRDGPLLNLRPDILDLAPGWLVTDERELRVGDAPPDPILIGLYDYQNGVRYTAQDLAGVTLPDDALKIPLQGCT